MRKPRLQRLDRLFTSEPVFFITACTPDRRRILANNTVQKAFVRFATDAAARGIFVGRYVIMPDHLHFFVAFAPTAPALSLWIKSLKNSLSKALRKQAVASPHWQKGFFDHVLRSDESYNEKWAYVVENPVRAGLVDAVSAWPYQGEIHPLEYRPS
jgi:putative transposase